MESHVFLYFRTWLNEYLEIRFFLDQNFFFGFLKTNFGGELGSASHRVQRGRRPYLHHIEINLNTYVRIIVLWVQFSLCTLHLCLIISLLVLWHLIFPIVAFFSLPPLQRFPPCSSNLNLSHPNIPLILSMNILPSRILLLLASSCSSFSHSTQTFLWTLSVHWRLRVLKKKLPTVAEGSSPVLDLRHW